MICSRGRAGIEPRLLWPGSPGSWPLHTPVPKWGPGWGVAQSPARSRGPVNPLSGPTSTRAN